MQMCHIVPDTHLMLGVKNSGFLFLNRLDEFAATALMETNKPILVAPPEGHGPDMYEKYLRQAEEVHADQVICPFVAGDVEKTWKTAQDFLEVYKRVGCKLKLMAIPQGTDWMTYDSCFMQFISLQDQFSSYGLPAKLLDRAGQDFTGVQGTYPNRPWLIRRKIMRYIRMYMWEIYLLEIGSGGAQELSECVGQFERVTRCVTAAAFGCAMTGRDLAKEGAQHPAPDLDFALLTKASEDTVALAYRNMQFLNDHARGIGA